ncbi:peroxidase 2-like [Aegilops tauschii subsp. strangulata]|uniref:Peroxidase 2 n=1 Tax=Aegilops tauschii TaxID=37682 RepID=M8C6I8_AEGTA|nr:peroxidase 1-like [Triticum aestivum]
MASSLSVLLLLCLAASSSAQLSPRFYARSCPRALAIIRTGVAAAVMRLRRVRTAERHGHLHRRPGAAPNAGSIQGMNVIDNIKAQVEAVCTQTISCADILTVAARDSVVAPICSTSLKANCPRTTGSGDGSLAPLDTTTPNAFDNAYYRNLMSQKGLLHSDLVLINDGRTAGLVRTYSSGSARFNRDFTAAMVRMGNISPLTGTQGQLHIITFVSDELYTLRKVMGYHRCTPPYGKSYGNDFNA